MPRRKDEKCIIYTSISTVNTEITAVTHLSSPPLAIYYFYTFFINIIKKYKQASACDNKHDDSH